MQELDYHCLIIIRQRFGETAYKIASSILSTPFQTIPELLKSTKLHIETVCNALTAFMQHDLLVLHPPRRVPRPPKRALTAKKKKLLETEDTHDYPTEVVPYPPSLGAPTTRLYGNQAAGFIPGLQSQIDAITSIGIYKPILSFRVVQHDPGLNIKMYRYTLNLDMVRGLARCGLYSAFCLEFFNGHVRDVIDEFGFRGKLTLVRAFELVLHRVVQDADIIRRSRERIDGIDPEYVADDFNSLTTAKIQEMSIYSFNKARLLAGVRPQILLAMDMVEEKRYIDTIPSITVAFSIAFDHHLLTYSRGFHDQNAQIGGFSDVSSTSTSTSSSTMGEDDTLDVNALLSNAATQTMAKKRRTAADGQGITAPPATRAKFGTSSSSSSYNILNDNDDSFNQKEELLSSSTTTTSVTDSTTLFVINHDRFTMYFRGELFVDYISRVISPFAGIICGAISFYLTSRTDSFTDRDMTSRQIHEAVSTYIQIKLASDPQLRIPQQQRDNLPNIDNLQKITTIAIAYNYIEVCGLTYDQISDYMTRLCQRNLAYELSDYREKRYGLMFEKITQGVRLEYTAQHIYARYGQHGARIFRLLQGIPRLEEKQISDFSLIPKREVKEIVHSLMRDGFVELLEVPTSTDRLNSNSKAFYLFGVNYQLAGVTMAKIYFKTFANLLSRLLSERKHRELVVDKGMISQHIELSIREEHQYHEYREIYTRIVQVMGSVLKPIILFYDLLPH